MPPRNETVVRRAVEEYWSGHTRDERAVALLEELFSADYSEHDPAAPWLPPGREGLWQKRALFLEVFPDFTARVESLLTSGDQVVVCWTVTGTQKAEIFGIAPSGRFVGIKGISVYRLAGGRIVSHTVNWDGLGLVRQLGGLQDSRWPKRLHDGGWT